jgi:micrococcal nuclease
MRRFVLGLLVQGLLLLGACTTHAPSGASWGNATVVKVTDGDTISVMVNGTKEKVRLIGIDTPETKKPDTPVQCFGPEASAYTTSLLPSGTEVRLERDVEPRDKYGRLLAYVYLASDHTFVNLQIIREGYARLLTIPPNVAHSQEFVTAARAAEAGDIGLWAGCTG